MWESVPDAHARTRDTRELDGARETLITLRVIVLEADLYARLADEVAAEVWGPTWSSTVSRKFRFFSLVEYSRRDCTFVRTPATVILLMMETVFQKNGKFLW